ncbi:MAG: hypothetical protein H7Y04_02430, partial [Verrucomicrobia bacterium]|nr:hypothetical protein [Cytophagales bacterium]
MKKITTSACILLLLLTSTVYFSSCKKKDEEPSVKDRITSGVWKFKLITAIEYTNGKETDRETEDLTGQTIEFKTDGTGILKEGTDSETFDWTLSADEKTLSLEGEDYTIKELSSSKFSFF